ncbi:Lipopolysaccharide export system ATP-binding protein LptB [archaeon HR01]|nr:Lipopolysaccharide export system ATP-binding protein LptB [archaeon HR01]
MAPILRCVDISVRFGGVTALRNLSIDVEKGIIHGVIGPNGAGKTTLFNTITGVVKPVSGKILFEGRDITGMKPYEICKLGIARTHQLIRPFKNMSVLENVLVAAYFGSGKIKVSESRRRADRAIKAVGLNGFEDRPAGSLDVLGQKKVEIARALAAEPKLLLLDEPVAGLTQLETDDIMRLVQSIKDEGVTVVLVEHVLKAVMSFSDRISVLNNGEKIYEGTPKEVGVAPQVVEAYLGEEYGVG